MRAERIGIPLCVKIRSSAPLNGDSGICFIVVLCRLTLDLRSNYRHLQASVRNFPAPVSSHFVSFIVWQTSLTCRVFESITVVAGRQLQVTVLAFSCLTTTQCSMSSAVGGGSWLRTGGGVAATGCFFAAQPARSRQNTSQAFLILFVLPLSCPLVDDNLGYWRQNIPAQVGISDFGARSAKLFSLLPTFEDTFSAGHKVRIKRICAATSAIQSVKSRGCGGISVQGLDG